MSLLTSNLQWRIQNHLAYKLGSALIAYDKAKHNPNCAGGGGNLSYNYSL